MSWGDDSREWPEQEWEFAQGFDVGDGMGWYISKSFGDDPSRPLEEGYVLLRRRIGPWEVFSDA